MAALENFFELLGDDESDDLAVVERAAPKPLPKPQYQKQPPQQQQQQQQQQTPPKLPSMPLPPSQAVKESRTSQFDSGRGRGGRGGGRESFGNRGRGREGGFNRPFRGGLQDDPGSYVDRGNTFNRGGNDFQGGRGGFYSRRGDAYVNGPALEQEGEGEQRFERARGRGRGRNRGRGYFEGGESFHPGYGDDFDGKSQQQRRDYEGSGTGRRDFERVGTGRRNRFNRHDAGGGDWGTEAEPAAPEERLETRAVEEPKPVTEVGEKQPAEEIKAEPQKVEEEKEKEDNEMLLDDYYKMLNDRKKHLSLRTDERKVTVDKDFEQMQLLNKKQDKGTSQKHVSDKDKGKKKENSDREEKTKKSVSINEFLRPTEGEEYYSSASRRSRGRGRGRSDHGGYRGGFGGSYNTSRQDLAPSIEDPGQFPTLGVK